MTAIEAIEGRTSVRRFAEKTIPQEALDAILRAGMSGPSCVNARDWAFLVVREKETLAKMADCNGRPAEPLRGADVGILVCGDLERAFPPAPDYWIIDGAIAAQNMVLAATELGIGSVWLGTYPEMDRVKAQAALFHLPEHVVPHSILALGYPEPSGGEARERTLPTDRVHYERW